MKTQDDIQKEVNRIDKEELSPAIWENAGTEWARIWRAKIEALKWVLE